MNLFFRLIWTYLFSRFRTKVQVLEACSTPFRVLPTDLDVLRHMNNGVYFSLQDLARTDYMIRIGALETITSKGWYPVVVAERLRFRKSLKLFDKFQIKTRLVYWDEKYIYLEHTFVRQQEVIAWGTIRARFLSKKGGVVSSFELIESLGHDLSVPPLTDYLQHWIAAEDSHSSAIQSN